MGLYNKTGFNLAKFEKERFGLGYGKMQWKNWSDVAWYYGLGSTVHCNLFELKRGNMTERLYESLCRSFGREQMDEYFQQEETQPKKQTKEEREIEELADLIVRGRVKKE